ncbi:MAG: complex I NDUFA9 subunit family protein [Alphaproteobacteria bacterium]|nr:complex I NDUFA9 subunit family protein [Alphaproteobacteria bacterium]
MQLKRVTIFGGSGFIGRYIVERLADQGVGVIVAVRSPERAKFLKLLGDVGQVVPVRASIEDADAIAAAVRGSGAVINLVGILAERGARSFRAVHVDGARRVAQAAADAGVQFLVQVSAIGAATDALSAYARSKAAGEAAVRKAFPRATILRPSIVFGTEDQFFNRFAALARCTPALLLFGGGRARFQPVWVGDVAAAAVRALGDPTAAGRTYELGGPRILDFAALMRLVLTETGRRRALVPIPFWLGEITGAVLSLLPNPPLTRDQVLSLRGDCIVGRKALTLGDLGLAPTPLEAIVPKMLARYRRRGV